MESRGGCPGRILEELFGKGGDRGPDRVFRKGLRGADQKSQLLDREDRLGFEGENCHHAWFSFRNGSSLVENDCGNLK